MNQNRLPHALTAFLTLLVIVACVLPGQPIQPAPVSNPVNIETAVAGTAQVAAQQTAAAQPVPTRRTGTTLQQSEDGYTLYSDYDAGFDVMFPPGWLVVRPNMEEINTVLANEGATNPILQEQIVLDLTGASAAAHLYAYILRPDIKENVVFGFTHVNWELSATTPIDSASMEEEVRKLESPEGLQGFHASQSEIRENSNGVQIIEIGGITTRANSQGELVTVYITVIFFKPTPDSAVRLIFEYHKDYQYEISPDVSFVVESISLLEP